VPRWLRLAASLSLIYEDNHPSKRLMVVANYDNDVPEYGVVRPGVISVRRVE